MKSLWPINLSAVPVHTSADEAPAGQKAVKKNVTPTSNGTAKPRTVSTSSNLATAKAKKSSSSQKGKNKGKDKDKDNKEAQ